MDIKKTKPTTTIQMKPIITVNNREIKDIISQIKPIKPTRTIIIYINRRVVIKYKGISMVILKKKTYFSIANQPFSIIPKKTRINIMKTSKIRTDLKLK